MAKINLSILAFIISLFVEQNISVAQSSPEIKSNKGIVFISDTQAPLWGEKLFLKENNNEKATALLFQNIVSIHPQALVITGDVTSLSCKEKKWKAIDGYLNSLKKNNIPFYALLGNHDIMRRKKSGERNFQKRFPEHASTGYVNVIDSIAIVMLNSNFKKLSSSQISKQDKWYQFITDSLEHESSVKFIVVCCHHSPYSNSKITGSSKQVQQHFVPLFLKSNKCKLFISGHSHAYEHFKKEGKNFLVIGGGGGLRHPLNKGSEALQSFDSDVEQRFHCITIKRNGNEISIKLHQLKNDFSGFDEKEILLH